MTSTRGLLGSVLVCCLAFLFAATTPAAATVAYTHANALNAFYFSKVTYCDANMIQSWTCGMSCKQHNNFRVSGVVTDADYSLQSYVGIDDEHKQVVVSFRGASDTSNMVGSAAGFPSTYDTRLGCGENCKVHIVYQMYYGRLRYYIRRYVIGALQWNPGYDVLVTGHSMGGALATLAAVDLQTQITRYGFDPRPLVHLYTFGAIRVGNKDFAFWANNVLYNGAHFHITHARDPVPRLPPTTLLGYLHVPQEIYYRTNDTSYVVCQDSASAEDPDCINRANGIDNDDHLWYLGMDTGCY